jgi:dTDP-4-amino-4,6-dideoxygalactose transaminase
LAAYSFHESKNYTSGGEGGLFIANDEGFAKRAEIIREKGTNRSEFFRGMVDKYGWIDVGSSYLPCELQAAYLWGQLQAVDLIKENRLATWSQYFNALQPLAEQRAIELPTIPSDCKHNGHMFYLKVRDLDERSQLISHLAKAGVHAVFHYIPLHSSTAGQEFGRFHGEDRYTTTESERLLRLPLWYGMPQSDVQIVTNAVQSFFT